MDRISDKDEAHLKKKLEKYLAKRILEIPLKPHKLTEKFFYGTYAAYMDIWETFIKKDCISQTVYSRKRKNKCKVETKPQRLPVGYEE